MKEERREKIKVALNQSEREILKTKMHRYGYRHISTYVRDACIYENIIAEDMEGKQEVLHMIAECMELTGKTLQLLQSLSLKPGLDKNDIHYIKTEIIRLNQKNDELKKIIIDRLNITYQKRQLRQKLKQECLKLEEGDE